MPSKKTLSPPIQQTAIGEDITQIAGNNNVVNKTIIQKIFQFLAGDAETADQRNRRIMLNHVEEFWVKGILEKSLSGAALLDLGIKEDPNALNYPWTIKREASQETLPLGKPMLEIFQEIGLGRSLLILGAPGSGKTTMLLELTQQLIERALQDVTEPIPVVFNLSSWIEKLTLADWLARELNAIYYVPKKVAPNWVKENKMLLLLDGLDEVKQESRNKCVDTINQFRKENGLTSMALCSRSQDYEELKVRLSFDGAVEIQPLTSKQVKSYFDRFGNRLTGIKQILKRDKTLREMAETPLFLSTMALAYKDKQCDDILISGNITEQRKYLFDTYIERMFERPARTKSERLKRRNVLHWLTRLAQTMIEHNQIPYLLENTQPTWLTQKEQGFYRLTIGLIYGLLFGLIFGLIMSLVIGLRAGMNIGLVGGLIVGLITALSSPKEIEMVDALIWNWKQGKVGLIIAVIVGPIVGVIASRFDGVFKELSQMVGGGPSVRFFLGLFFGLFLGLLLGFEEILSARAIAQTTYPGQKIYLSIRNSFLAFLFFGLIGGFIGGLIGGLFSRPIIRGVIIFGFIGGWFGAEEYGCLAVIRHYTLRFIFAIQRFLPFRIIPLLNYCTDLIFLRRVGGGYIFVHRLLMEHFAAMDPEEQK